MSEAVRASLRADRRQRRRARSSRSSSPTQASETAYQSEADLEREFIRLLQSQAYEYLPHHVRGAAGRQPAHAAGGAERDHVLGRRVGAVLQREDRRVRTKASSRRRSVSRRTTSSS